MIFIWSACSQDIATKAINQIPEIEILLPSTDGNLMDGNWIEGSTILLEAQVTDSRDRPEEYFVEWYVDSEIICEWNNPNDYLMSYCEWNIPMNTMPEQEKEIRAVVRDVRQAGGSDSMQVLIISSNSPTAEIQHPTSGSEFYAGEQFLLEGIVGDIETDLSLLYVEWRSSIDGVLESGVEILDDEGHVSTMISLNMGAHIISLYVKDGDDKSHFAQIPVLIKPENSAPMCSITYPTGTSSSLFGAIAELTAQVSDVDISTTRLKNEWYSDRDGFLGESMASDNGEVILPIQSLSSGNHQISIVVTDEMGLICEDELSHFVGEPPNVNIDYPFSGDIFNINEEIPFDGWVADPDQNASELLISWSSSIDGMFWEGTPNTLGHSNPVYSALSGGNHIITLTVTDAQNLSAHDSISININTPPPAPIVSISPYPAFTSDTLTIQITPSPDVDGQIPTYTYAWMQNGQPTNLTGPTISSIFTNTNDIWSVEVTPFDGITYGTVAQTQILIENAPPTITSIAITPNSSVYNDMEISCLAVGNDIDDQTGAEFEIFYTWFNDTTGVLLGEGNTLSLSSDIALPKENVRCEAKIVDSAFHEEVSSTSISISNRFPTVSSVTTSDSEISTNGLLGCFVEGDDVDGEDLVTDFRWYYFPQGDSNQKQLVSINSQLQLDTSLVHPGDFVNCIGRVTDNAQAQASLESDWVAVINSPPIITSMLLNPPTGVINTGVLTCLIQGYDVDGISVDIDYEWENITSGISLGTTPSITLNPNLSSSGDIISCTATITDQDGSSVSQSMQIAVRNGTPLIGDVVISNQNGSSIMISESSLNCSASASDPDGNILIPEYTWFNASTATELGVGNTVVLTNDTSSPDDIILCTATVNDGSGGSDAASSAIILDNRLPVIDSIELIGWDVDGNVTTMYNSSSRFSVEVQASDLDEDDIEFRYLWSVNGQTIPGNSDWFSGTVDKYQIIDVTVVPFDGREEGIGVSSDYAIIQNSKPTIPEIELLPLEPVEKEDDLVCTITKRSEDPDPSDSVVYDFTFIYTTIDNPSLQTYIGVQNTTYYEEDTIPASEISAWETWFCKVRALDSDLLYQPSAATAVLSDIVEIAAKCDPEDGPKLFEYGLDFTCILPDIFMMGSPSSELGRSEGNDADEDLHAVGLTHPFFVATTEVTQSMFEGLMHYNPSQYSNCGGDCPVEKVDWHEAAAFSNLLTRYHNSLLFDTTEYLEECYICEDLEHLSSIDPNWPNIAKSMTCIAAMDPYDCSGYRLPTESEWELSARAYSYHSFWTPNGGGDFADITENLCSKSNPVVLDDGTNIKDYMWFCANQPYNASQGILYYYPEVGGKLPNGFGMYDMHGNVSEWTHDTYVQHLGNDSLIDPVSTDESLNAIVGDKVTRGGYSLQNPVDMRCAFREKNSANYAGSTIGFRVARSFVD